MKKVLSVILFAAMILSLCAFNIGAAWDGTTVSASLAGEGTQDSPYVVETAADLAFLAKSVNEGNSYEGKYIVQTADIDLGGEVFSRYIFSEFHGTIDGNGKTVKNFSIVGTADGYNAIIANANGFLYIKDLNVGTADAPISVTGAQAASSGSAVLVGFGNEQYNCIISNVNIYGNINIEDNYKAMTAGFFAQSKNVLIENSTFNGTIKVGKTDVLYDQYRNVAGFIGSCSGSAVVIKNCTNNANITLAPATKEARAAGFVGYTDRMINLIGCTNNGNITVLDLGETKSGTQLGGIVAHTNHYASVFDNCKNNGTLTASSGLGQIVGKATAGAYLVGGTSGTFSATVGADGSTGCGATSSFFNVESFGGESFTVLVETALFAASVTGAVNLIVGADGAGCAAGCGAGAFSTTVGADAML